ncbi:glycosyltransferase family 39 protein [Candidatus Microgenomates bacterium]|nr:glycosyltransferase family 39 protein [Candidatus Microgenomates bacterium]
MSLKNIIILLVIVALAAILRFYQLGQVPPGLDWDEASLGWNAYSILKTGSDEYGKPWPVSLQSFSDYKPALYAYVTIPSVAVFGLNEFAVRFPSALAGLLTVILTFFLVKELTNDKLLGYWVTGLLAISPWHLQFSRVAFEANLALFFFVLGAFFLSRFLHRRSRVALMVSLLAFVLAIYSYHSPRVVIPVFLAGIALYYRRIFLSHWRLVLVSGLLVLVFLYPLARNTLHTGALSARYQTVAARLDPQVLAANYLRHFSLNFLFITGDGQNRHHAPDMGLLYLWELPFLLAGGYFLAVRRPNWLPFFGVWFLAAPVAAALANDAPHAVRSLLFLPTFQIVTAYGLIKTLKTLKILKLLIVFFALGNIFYFLHQYFIHLSVEAAPAWQFGYKQMVKKVLAIENQYNRIYVTNAYDQPYIYFLFYGRIDPVIKNSGFFYSGFDKYEFSLAKVDPRGLYVVSPEDRVPGFSAFDQVNFPDGTTAFQLGTIK